MEKRKSRSKIVPHLLEEKGDSLEKERFDFTIFWFINFLVLKMEGYKIPNVDWSQ